MWLCTPAQAGACPWQGLCQSLAAPGGCRARWSSSPPAEPQRGLQQRRRRPAVAAPRRLPLSAGLRVHWRALQQTCSPSACCSPQSHSAGMSGSTWAARLWGAGPCPLLSSLLLSAPALLQAPAVSSAQLVCAGRRSLQLGHLSALLPVPLLGLPVLLKQGPRLRVRHSLHPQHGGPGRPSLAAPVQTAQQGRASPWSGPDRTPATASSPSWSIPEEERAPRVGAQPAVRPWRRSPPSCPR